MNTLKWIGSCIIAILLVGVGIAAVMFVVSIAGFVFIGAAIIFVLALITVGVRTLMKKKS